MKKAGYPSGKYTGAPLLTVADNQSPAKETAEALQQQLSTIGFKLKLREVPHATLTREVLRHPEGERGHLPERSAGARTSSTHSR